MKGQFWCAEEHGEILLKWHQLGFDSRTVVCLDRHFDVKRIGPQRLAHLLAAATNSSDLADAMKWCPFTDTKAHAFGSDDFLYASAALGMVKHVIWVYPEFAAGSDRQLADVLWDNLKLIPDHGRQILDSIKRTDALLSASVGKATVSICTISRLSSQLNALEEGWHLDVDLDYFWDDEDLVVRNLDETITLARALPMRSTQHVTAAYSISSGYLPEDARWLGKYLCDAFSCEYHELSTRRFPEYDEWTLLLGRSGRRSNPERYDVDVVSGTRHALRALLALKSGDIGAAERLCGLARDEGDLATWPAYKLGLHYLERNAYKEASHWFRSACMDVYDSIQAHSLCLLALSEFRLAKYEEAFSLAAQCVDRLPMCDEGYLIASHSAAQLGLRTDDVGRYERQLQEMQCKRLKLGT